VTAGGLSADVALFRRLLALARPYRLRLMALLAVGSLASPIALLAPLPLKIVVDSVLGPHPPPRLLVTLLPSAWTRTPGPLLAIVAGMVIVVALLNHLRELTVALLRASTAGKLTLEVRARLFRHAQRLSLAYHESAGIADSAYRIQNDAPALQYVVIDGVIPLFTASVTFAGMVAVTAVVDWRLALVAMTISPVLLALSHTFRRRLRRQAREVKALESSSLSVVQEVLAAVRIVKAFAQEDRESERFARHSTATMRARVRMALAEGGYALLVGLVMAVGTAAVMLIGVRSVRSGTLTLGALLLVLGYLAQLYEPLKSMSRKAADLQGHLASAERAFSLLDQAPDVPERPSARRVVRATGTVSFRAVSFGYAPDRQVLRDVSFHVEPGTRLGLAGATGAGKTTLINLLVRFFDPTAGEILLDGVDLRDYRVSDLRNQYAIVPQEPVLFATSIAENIAYARPDASEREIVAAAEAANAHEFIRRLPLGYETQVGDRGMRLSGGERQRVAIARAFLKDAPLLVFDEPTSAIDMRTETAIVDAMERLMRGRTSFLITHRPSTLSSCDRVLQVEGGRVTATTDVAAIRPKLPLPGSEDRGARAGARLGSRREDA
jgi:ATP-binding cassette, subfamily B, bacterial